MCKKTNYRKTSNTHIDKCIRHLISSLNQHGYVTVSSCCGHGKYPLTVICRVHGRRNRFYELISGKEIPRTRNFYKRDKEGFYYIPETIEGT